MDRSWVTRRQYTGGVPGVQFDHSASPPLPFGAINCIRRTHASRAVGHGPRAGSDDRYSGAGDIAQTAGYLQDEGIQLDVVLAGGGPKAMTGLVGGGGQFSASVLFDGVMAHRRGLDDVRALATLSLFQGPMAVRSEIAKQRGLSLNTPLKQRLEAMKGLRIGITTPGATSDLFMRYLFRSIGMNPDHDLEIVPLGGVSSQVAALQAGRVDGCSCLPPVEVLTGMQGLTVDVIDRLKDIPQLAGVSYGTLYGLASYNKQHPDIAYAMARAVTRAELLIAHDPAAAKRATRPFLKEMDDAAFDTAWQNYLPAFPTSPDITETSFAKELEFEKSVLPPNSNGPVPYSEAVDVSFVRRAMQELTH
jgi:NitT/TauT family transport system substrate-binding protein